MTRRQGAQRFAISFIAAVGAVISVSLVVSKDVSEAQTTTFTCTQFIGYSQTSQWIARAAITMNAGGPDRVQLLWNSGGATHKWADPNYVGWSNALQSPCAQSASAPDRVIMDVTHDEYLTAARYGDATGYMEQVIRDVVATIRQEYPSVRQIVLQPVVGGPNETTCPWSGAEQGVVRASYNHPIIHEAALRVVGGSVVFGANPGVRTCADYADDQGHLITDGATAAGNSIGQFYLNNSPPPATATPQRTATRTAIPTATRTPLATSTRTAVPTATRTALATSTRTPLPTATPSPTATPLRSATPLPPSLTTVPFDDVPGQEHLLTGQYPAGVIDWGAGTWWLDGPWGAFQTKSVSFTNSRSSSSFTLISPRRLVRLDVFNGGAAGTTVTLSCAGQPTKQVTLAAGAANTVETGWAGACSTVTISTTNGNLTNFDNLRFDTVVPTATPRPTSTSTPLPTPGVGATATATPVRTATPTPPVGGTSGRFSAKLNGSTSYADVPHSQELSPQADWTVEAWFKDENPAGYDHPRARIVTKGDAHLSGDVPYALSIASNQLGVVMRTNGQYVTLTWDLAANQIAPSTWHHAAATFRSSTRELALYVDGTLVARGTSPVGTANNTDPVTIGSDGPTASDSFWTGKLDDIRIWNVARTAAQIQSNYLGELQGAQSGLVGNWKFTEGTGQTAADSAGTPQNATLHSVTWAADVHS